MASNKPTMILQSKTDLSTEEIAALSDGEAWKLIYSIRITKAKDNRLQVCFTGFGTSRKQDLINIANNNKFKVVASVTKKTRLPLWWRKCWPKENRKSRIPRGAVFK